MNKTKKAFTIVELVIVIAVIAILMGIMFIGGTAISNNAKQATMDSDLRSYEVNLKSMVNDPDNVDLLTTDATDGVNEAKIKTELDNYLEDELKLAGDFSAAYAAATGVGKVDKAKSAASRESVEQASAQLDPYGMPYHVVVMDNSDSEHTDIVLMAYSYGKNKQTAATGSGEGMFDKDDVARIVRIYDSVIYTASFGPKCDASADADIAYMTAVDNATKAVSGLTHIVAE